MKQPKLPALNILSAATFLLAVSACNNSDRDIPFPKDESEFAQPVSRPFKFSEQQEIKWVITNPDSIKPLPEKKFYFDKLPSKPFEIGEPYPLLKPLDEVKFAVDSLRDTAFSLNNLPTQKFKFKNILTGAPKIIKANLPTIKPGTSRGIMDAGPDMGLKGNGRCFLQDDEGQLWIGTDKGLYRYDGENWEVYGAAQGLSGESIFSILEDQQSRIWIGGDNGEIFVLDRKAGLLKQLIDTFQHNSILGMIQDKEGQIWLTRNNAGVFIVNTQNETIKQFSTKEGLANTFVVKILQDRQGLIWIGTGNGVNMIDLKTGTNKKLNAANGIRGNQVISLLQDDRDRIWIGTEGGANIIDLKDATIKHLWTDQGIGHSNFMSGLLQDRDGKIWMGTDTGTVYSFDERLGLLEKFHVADGSFNIIYNLFEDKEGQIWMGTTKGGCYFINPNNGRPGNFTTAAGLGNNRVWSVLEDKNGYIWIGTVDGIDVYDPVSKSVKHIGKEQGLLNERSTTLFQDSKGQIWASGGGQGISIIDIKNGVIKHLAMAQGLTKNDVTSFVEDGSGQMWAGTGDGDVSMIDLNERVIKKLSNVPELKDTRVNTLRIDRWGQLWIGNIGNGVYVMDADRKTIKRLSTAQGLISNDVTTFLEDSIGHMWIGTEKGIDVADLKNNTLTSFTTNEGLAANGLYTLNEKNRSIYVGTSNGLTVLTPTEKENKQEPIWRAASYGRAQGLTFLDFAENSSLFKKNGQFWAGVEEQILTVINEIKPDTVTAPAYITGINILDKPQIFSNRVITEDRIENIDTLWKVEKDSFYANKKLPVENGYLQKNKIAWDSVEGPYNLPVNLNLPYNQNYLSFTFNGTHISNPDKAVYRYVLEGIDKNWSPISESNISENYRDLSPGTYTFKVSSKGMNGIWSSPASFSFTILPPWWKTWWAYAIYILIAGGLVWAFAQYRSRKLQRENMLLEEKITRRTMQLQRSIEDLKSTQTQLIQSEKMASLGELTAGIAHEIQNPLNFVNNFSEVNTELIDEMQQALQSGNTDEAFSISNDIKDNEQKIIHHGKRADSIVKGMLLHSRTSTGKKEPTDINALADEYLRLSYHGLRAKDKSFNATMNTDFDESVGQINVIQQDIGRVLLNLINNAFYAVTEKKKAPQPPKGGVEYEPTVSVTTRLIIPPSGGPRGVEIKVSDNGNGIPKKVVDKIFQPFFTTKPTGQGTGLGLSLSYDIIKAHGGEIKVETKEGEGSEFIIILPV